MHEDQAIKAIFEFVEKHQQWPKYSKFDSNEKSLAKWLARLLKTNPAFKKNLYDLCPNRKPVKEVSYGPKRAAKDVNLDVVLEFMEAHDGHRPRQLQDGSYESVLASRMSAYLNKSSKQFSQEFKNTIDARDPVIYRGDTEGMLRNLEKFIVTYDRLPLTSSKDKLERKLAQFRADYQKSLGLPNLRISDPAREYLMAKTFDKFVLEHECPPSFKSKDKKERSLARWIYKRKRHGQDTESQEPWKKV